MGDKLTEKEVTSTEQYLLSSLLMDSDMYPLVKDIVKAEYFYETRHAYIYSAMSEVFESGATIDIITVVNNLASKKLLTQVGGRTYIVDLLTLVPYSSHAIDYAKIVKENAMRRMLAVLSDKLKEDAFDGSIKFTELLHSTEEEMYNISMLSMQRSSEREKNQIEQYMEFKDEFREMSDRGMLGMSTGIDKLDKATYGLIPNHIWVCGGYYGYGKTYFAINLINSVLEQDKKVMLFTLEMTSSEIIQRLVSLRAELNLIETLSLLPEDKAQKRNEAEEFIFDKIKTSKLIIIDYVRDSNDMLSKMIIEDSKSHVDFVALDYIQLLAGEDQYESLREATKNIQAMTKQIHTTTLILSQVSNDTQKEGDFSRVDGFKGAGDIGQIANVAIKIKRERDQESGEFSSFYGLRLTKIRHGKPCSLKCDIKFPSGRIVGISTVMDQFDDLGAKEEKEISSLF